MAKYLVVYQKSLDTACYHRAASGMFFTLNEAEEIVQSLLHLEPDMQIKLVPSQNFGPYNFQIGDEVWVQNRATKTLHRTKIIDRCQHAKYGNSYRCTHESWWTSEDWFVKIDIFPTKVYL